MTVVFGLILVISLCLLIVAYKQENEFIKSLSKKEHPLWILYPVILILIDKTNEIGRRNKKKGRYFNNYREQEQRELIKALAIGENFEKALRIHQCRKGALALFIFILFDLFAFLGSLEGYDSTGIIDGKYLERPSPGEDDVLIRLTAVIKDAAGKAFQKELRIPVSSQDYTAGEADEILKKAEAYLDKVVLGDNISADSIYTSLKLPDRIPGTEVRIKWTSSDMQILSNNGTLHNEEITESRIIQLTALMALKENSVSYSRAYVIQPKVYTEEEKALRALDQALEKEDKMSTKVRLTLPDKILGYSITWTEEKERGAVKIFGFGVAAAFLSLFIINRELGSMGEKRKKELLMEYPEIINKFMLLVNAGMAPSNAWIKIAGDYRDKGGVRKYAYEEMALTAGELKIGISESTAYENFGKRVKLIPYLRFISLVSQNIQKGSPEFFHKLEEEAVKAFEERKETARKAGEEAGTRLLLPMMVMLVLIMSIILFPAMSSFSL